MTKSLVSCFFLTHGVVLLQISNNHVNVREQNGADRQTDVEQT